MSGFQVDVVGFENEIGYLFYIIFILDVLDCSMFTFIETPLLSSTMLAIYSPSCNENVKKTLLNVDDLLHRMKIIRGGNIEFISISMTYNLFYYTF